MKFYNYLNEKVITDIEEIVTLIKKDCQPYLKDVKFKYNKEFLMSGRKEKQFFLKKKIRTDREPKDMPQDLHEFLDDWFYKKFGVKARSNSIFCSFNEPSLFSYGTPYYVFPIGNYTTISSLKVKDLYMVIDDELAGHYMPSLEDYYSIDPEVYPDTNLSDFYDDLEKLLIKWNYKKNIYNPKNELMLNCKEVYLLKKVEIGILELNNLLN